MSNYTGEQLDNAFYRLSQVGYENLTAEEKQIVDTEREAEYRNGRLWCWQ